MALQLLTQGWIARTLKILTVTFKAIITALIPILSKGFITLQQRRGVFFFPMFKYLQNQGFCPSQSLLNTAKWHNHTRNLTKTLNYVRKCWMQTSQENNSRQTVHAYQNPKRWGLRNLLSHRYKFEYLNNMITMCSLQLITESSFCFIHF